MTLYDKHDELLANIKRDHVALSELLEKVTGTWNEEDYVYRFWHQSFKVFYLQGSTLELVGALRAIAPEDTNMDEWFEQIVAEGTGKTFEVEMNRRWLEETRPIVEAFWHAKYFVKMAVKYGTMEEAPSLLPSGWASLLHLYGIR